MYRLRYTNGETGDVCEVIVGERGLRERLAHNDVVMPTYDRLTAAEMRAAVTERIDLTPEVITPDMH